MEGQHRVGALEILLANGTMEKNTEVLVEVFPDVSDDKAAALFT